MVSSIGYSLIQVGIFTSARKAEEEEDTMSDLIKRFREDLQLSGYAQRSIQSYISSVLRLQRFYNKPLEEITEEELRQYWVCCQSEFGWSAASFYLTLYSLGLRLREATTLQVRDILSERGLVHIHAGKGALDRMVPLPKITLETLRKYYSTHRNPKL